MGKKTVFIVAFLAVIGVGAFFLFRRKAIASAPEVVGSPIKSQEDPAVNAAAASLYPFIPGSRADIIHDIQHALNLSYNAGLAEDSVWGPKTALAVMKYTGRYTAYSYADAVHIYSSILKKVKP